MTEQEYRSAEGLNWSAAKHLETSPAHFRQAMASPAEPTKQMRVGTATHALALQPELVALLPKLDLSGITTKDEIGRAHV